MTTVIDGAPPAATTGIDLLIFECDGVLIDSERIASRVAARELAAHGIEISAAVLAERFTGVPYADMYRTLEGEADVRLPSDFARRTHELVFHACVSEPSLAVPG